MELKDLREKIDSIDDELVELLLERLEVSRQVADIKALKNMPVFNPEREKEILDEIKDKTGEDAKYILPIIETILKTSKELQEDALKERKGR